MIHLRSINDPELLSWISSNVSDTIAGAEMKKYDESNNLKWVAAAISSFRFTVNNNTLKNAIYPSLLLGKILHLLNFLLLPHKIILLWGMHLTQPQILVFIKLFCKNSVGKVDGNHLLYGREFSNL